MQTREEERGFLGGTPGFVNETILGDFSARIGDTVVPGIKQRFNESVTNENGELMVTSCSTDELRINNTFFKNKMQYKYTFDNTRSYRSMIDYVLTNRSIQSKNILNVGFQTSANVGSDDNFLLCKLRM